MNQMMGSAATSLSSMLNKKIDISPPIADLIDLQENVDEGSIDKFLTGRFVKISFKMEIGDLVDSEIMQLYPFSFAREMCEGVSKNMEMESESLMNEGETKAAPTQTAQTAQATAQQPNMGAAQMMNQQMAAQQNSYAQQPVNVQPAQFQPFTAGNVGNYNPENIGLIMDVPLQVTVELGRTTKSISDILDFSPGKIIELDKLAGEPIDILVNGKNVAKGEVVVIEESFGVRITEIINNGRPII